MSALCYKHNKCIFIFNKISSRTALHYTWQLIWVKGTSARSITCMGKKAAAALLKLFINGNEICHTTDASNRMTGIIFLNVNKFQYKTVENNTHYTLLNLKNYVALVESTYRITIVHIRCRVKQCWRSNRFVQLRLPW